MNVRLSIFREGQLADSQKNRLSRLLEGERERHRGQPEDSKKESKWVNSRAD